MDITVTFHNGRWVTDPSPAIVRVRTRVRWVFRTPNLQNQTLLWKVSFRKRLPFDGEHSTLEVTTEPTDHLERAVYDRETLRDLNLPEDAPITHRGETKTQTADSPGQYKYDLSVQDAVSEETIGDDDPWLIVVRELHPLGFYAF